MDSFVTVRVATTARYWGYGRRDADARIIQTAVGTSFERGMSAEEASDHIVSPLTN